MSARASLARGLAMQDRVEDAIKLGGCEELQVRVGIAGAPPARARRVLDRVARRPALLDRGPEDRVQEGHHVATVVGDAPRASIARASRSTSWVDTASTIGSHECVTRALPCGVSRLAAVAHGFEVIRKAEERKYSKIAHALRLVIQQVQRAVLATARCGRVVLRVFKSSHGVMKMGLGVLAL